VITTSSYTVRPGIAIEPWTIPIRQVEAGGAVSSLGAAAADAGDRPWSGLCGALFVANTRPWTTASSAPR
jgi:hypothetical protein